MKTKYSFVHLAQYIKRNASGSTINRARFISRRKKDAVKVVSLQGHSINFLVEDYRPFLVRIDNFMDGNRIKRLCNCGNGKSRMCVHQVVGFYALMDLFQDPDFQKQLDSVSPQVKSVIKERNTTTPMAIGKMEKLDMEHVLELADPYELESHSHSFRALNWYENLGTVSVDIIQGYWDEGETVEYFYKDGQWYSKCTCADLCNGLCFHEVAGLSYFRDEEGEDYFANLNPKRYDKERKELIKWAGIKESDFDKNFEFDFEKKVFLPKGKLKGLINFAQANKLQPLSKISRQQQIPVRIINEQKDIYSLGYVLDVFQSIDGFPKITPVLGQEAKKGGQKSLKNYFDFPNVQIEKSKKDDAILAKVRMLYNIDNGLEPISYDEDSKEFFHIFREVLQMLSEQTYNYLRFRKSIYDNKVRKSDIVPISVAPNPAKLFFEFSEDAQFVVLKAKLNLGHKTISIPANKPGDKFISAFLLRHEGVLYGHDSYEQASVLAQNIALNPVFKAKKEDVDLFFEQIVKPISDQFPVRIGALKTLKHNEHLMKAKNKRVYLSDMGNFVIIEPAIVYDKEIVKI